MIFETERLRARVLTLDDADSCFDIYGNPEVTRYVMSDGEPVGSVAVVEYLLQYGMLAPRRDPRFGFWALERRQDDTMVGTVALVEIEESEGEYEFGWHLSREYWGHGYANESGLALLRYGFEVAGLDRILALVHPDNDRSLRACERLGMARIGMRMNQGYEHVCFESQRAAGREVSRSIDSEGPVLT